MNIIAAAILAATWRAADIAHARMDHGDDRRRAFAARSALVAATYHALDAFCPDHCAACKAGH